MTSSATQAASLATVRLAESDALLLEMKDTLRENGARSGSTACSGTQAKIVQFKPNVFRRREDETNVNSALASTE